MKDSWPWLAAFGLGGGFISIVVHVIAMIGSLPVDTRYFWLSILVFIASAYAIYLNDKQKEY